MLLIGKAESLLRARLWYAMLRMGQSASKQYLIMKKYKVLVLCYSVVAVRK